MHGHSNQFTSDCNGSGSYPPADGNIEHLFPGGLEFLIEERPLLWFEDPAEFDTLRAAVFVQLMPRSVIDALLVKNLVDLLWEWRRVKKLKEAGVNYLMPGVAAGIITSGVEKGHQYDARKRMDEIAQAAAVGADQNLKENEDSFESACKQSHLRPEMIHYQVFTKEADSIIRITREVERLEHRFRRLLKEFEDRQASVAAMAKTLVAREKAGVIDATPGP